NHFDLRHRRTRAPRPVPAHHRGHSSRGLARRTTQSQVPAHQSAVQEHRHKTTVLEKTNHPGRLYGRNRSGESTILSGFRGRKKISLPHVRVNEGIKETQKPDRFFPRAFHAPPARLRGNEIAKRTAAESKHPRLESTAGCRFGRRYLPHFPR